MSNLIQLRHPPKPGEKVKMGSGPGAIYTLTRIEGRKLFGIQEGYPGIERFITADYKTPKDPMVVITTLEGKRLQ